MALSFASLSFLTPHIRVHIGYTHECTSAYTHMYTNGSGEVLCYEPDHWAV